MTLAELITELKTMTGRYDLSDTRATALIVDGQTLLDGMIDLSNTLRLTSYNVVAGEYSKTIYYMAGIRHAYWIDSTGAYQEELTRLDWSDFVARYEDISDEGSGTPEYYALQSTTHEGTQNITTIYFGPPAEEAGTLELHGQFSIERLANSDDTNIWSVAYPYVLLEAACLRLETQMRNSQGVADYSKSLAIMVEAIDHFTAATEDPGYAELQG